MLVEDILLYTTICHLQNWDIVLLLSRFLLFFWFFKCSLFTHLFNLKIHYIFSCVLKSGNLLNKGTTSNGVPIQTSHYGAPFLVMPSSLGVSLHFISPMFSAKRTILSPFTKEYRAQGTLSSISLHFINKGTNPERKRKYKTKGPRT